MQFKTKKCMTKQKNFMEKKKFLIHFGWNINSSPEPCFGKNCNGEDYKVVSLSKNK